MSEDAESSSTVSHGSEEIFALSEHLLHDVSRFFEGVGGDLGGADDGKSRDFLSLSVEGRDAVLGIGVKAKALVQSFALDWELESARFSYDEEFLPDRCGNDGVVAWGEGFLGCFFAIDFESHDLHIFLAAVEDP